ncbi:putative protein kinase RLK-Pelle-SD-2b family [Rosa chinensis]|uniref:Receptor-like serine/threonine-protein kinase n=1 Tax=Rosa chinensis TaxID=74649 RepID=A0A2P6Q0N7_ROSCH|nr:putative protein kinase RLK-Pelle-SD-2b family [Rosa chinensis]
MIWSIFRSGCCWYEYSWIMAALFHILLLFLAIYFQISSSTSDTLNKGSSLSVEKPDDVLTSPDGVFTAGFHQVGNNSFCFAIWFSEPFDHYKNRTIVWMANRGQPVNGKHSKLSLLKTGDLILTDAGQSIVWSTATTSVSQENLSLHNSGNLVLLNSEHVILWQSFDHPTDTLLPDQPLTRSTILVSMRSPSNYSSGFYKLFFDHDNLLRLLFDGLEISSVYWFEPWQTGRTARRSKDNNSRVAVMDSLGNFTSSDKYTLIASDYGAASQRRLTVDCDGNVRLHSRAKPGDRWVVTGQIMENACLIHGVCGPNSVCDYEPSTGRKCSCIPGYKMANYTDWYYGCEPEFNYTCGRGESSFFKLSRLDFYGSPSFFGDIYLRVPKIHLSSYGLPQEEYRLRCLDKVVELDRSYEKSHVTGLEKFLLWFACGVGGFEIICILLVLGLITQNRRDSNEDKHGYLLAATGFKRFSYAELKKATRDFSQEIGSGAGGVVYKAVLADHRVAAIKRLNETNQGEGEFSAEVNTIGRLNHMHLIEMWGYCSEGKHGLLVYEYMEHGSLAQKLPSNVLDWEKRFEIALGIAKGLAYLHEECLEWVLHCDVKPQNILLDSNYQPKVADFGLSKLLNRDDLKNWSFSRIRGTRGYIAPEWVYNLPITSKVDVYSYGVVVLEMVTGKNPIKLDVDAIDGEQRRMIVWVREKLHNGTSASEIEARIGDVIDPSFEGKYDVKNMGILLEVALQCVEEDRDARPTMSQVVEMLVLLDKDQEH